MYFFIILKWLISSFLIYFRMRRIPLCYSNILILYLVYLIVIAPIFVFFNGKMNLLYKCLFYFIFPYFLSLFAWYTHIYFYLPQNSNLGNGTLLGEFGYITVTIYIIYGSFLIPLVACLCEIFIRLLYRYLYRFY